eukprot:1050987-Prymnesium_polylepis.1
MASPRQPLGELSANVLFGSPGATPPATPLHTPTQGTARTPASVSSTARVRLWRQRNPERSREQNRRADANRAGTDRRREQLAAAHADRQAAARARNDVIPLTEAADCVLANMHG